MMGNLPELQEQDPGVKQMEWTDKYGGVVSYRGMIGTRRLLVSDPKALQHVLMNSYNFPKPAGLRAALANILGEGVLTAEGHKHKIQRKMVNPTFNNASVRQFTPVFNRHARALVKAVDELYHNKDHEALSPATDRLQGAFRKRNLGTVIDVLHWTSRTTLDVIGETAFSYDLAALKSGENGTAIAASFNKMMTHVGELTIKERALLHIEQFSFFDGHRPLKTSFNKSAIDTQKTVEDVAGRMIDEQKKAQVVEESDLLSGILACNEDPKVPASQRMSRREVLGQLTTLILAGHETTSTSLTWTLWALATHPEIQTRLRDEIKDFWCDVDDDLLFDEIHELEYLDRVTSETLRLHPPVHSTNREPAKDGYIPLSKPIRQADGTLTDRVLVSKGQPLILSVVVYNRRKDIWGEDAMEFKPDRWLNLPEAVTKSGIPGGHLAFISGPRNCVGSKFALTEFKVILAHLLRRFEFMPLPEDLVDISSKQIIVTRPRVKGLESEGTQMPLLIKPIKEA
ncbi:cytochrome P450 [Jaminaea rosea]|uniref:Cytochrome P450 n=1 Tax=Jaminaea rosea TaxID=1569628 RepID=A0A316V6M0_9BASI|nr:cytochrome P450 [Jaminaea rosea]PWN31095.1 cytochrome P450 [Jaminaea rosea]